MSYENPRITLDDSAFSAGMKLSEGNPGAATVIGQILHNAARIDPDDAFGAFGPILALDTHDIYGPDIWRLYKDVCGHDLTKMLGLLRAVQLGYLRESELKKAIRGPDTVDVDFYVSQVKERLPAFGRV